MASRQTPAELARCDLAKTAEREHTPTATATTPSVAGNVMPMSVRSLPLRCARVRVCNPMTRPSRLWITNRTGTALR